jgi:hypothetical protein
VARPQQRPDGDRRPAPTEEQSDRGEQLAQSVQRIKREFRALSRAQGRAGVLTGRALYKPRYATPTRGDRAAAAKALKSGFARLKAKAMDPEIARNQNYDDHYTNDGKYVHFALLPLHDDSARYARRHVPRRYQHHGVIGCLGSTEAGRASPSHCYRHRLYPQ